MYIIPLRPNMSRLLPRLLAFVFLISISLLAQGHDSTEAIALEQQGKLAEATEAWRAVIKQHPQDAGAYASLGVVLSRQQRYPEAAAAYKKALALNPKLPGIPLNLGLAEFKQGKFHAAIQPLTAAVAANPKDPQPRTLLGISYYGDKQFAKAAENLRLAAQADPANTELQQMLAQSCLWARQYQCALDGFREIVRTQPDSASAHILMGEALDGTGKTPEAIVEFQKAAQASPREPNVHFGLGFLYWKQHDYDKAKPEFETELANDPKNAQAAAYLGDTELKLGNRKEATAFLNQAIQLRSDVRIAYIDLGVLAAEEKKYEDAVAAFRKAIALDPNEPDAHYRLSQAYKALGRTAEAEKEFKLVQRLHQQSDTNLTPKMSGAPPPVPQ